MQLLRAVPVRILIAALTGVLAVGAWATLTLSLMEAIFTGWFAPAGIILGLFLLVSGPVLLGLTNARLPCALLAGLLAPVVALVVSGAWSVSMSILGSIFGPLPLGRATTLAIVNVAALVGTTELVSRRPFKVQAVHVLRGVGLALFIAFGLEFVRSLITVMVGPISETESRVWLVVGAYAVITGVNIVCFGDSYRSPGNRASNLAIGMFLSLNLLGLGAVVATSIVA